MTPDPAGLAAVTLGSPQSLNQYAYGLGNPLLYIDPSGLDSSCDDPSACDGGYSDPGFGLGDGYGGVYLGGPIWNEQVPVYNGPSIDPRLIIQNVIRTDANGNTIGDLGDQICTLDAGNNCIWVFWSPSSQRWESKRPPSSSAPRTSEQQHEARCFAITASVKTLTVTATANGLVAAGAVAVGTFIPITAPAALPFAAITGGIAGIEALGAAGLDLYGFVSGCK